MKSAVLESSALDRFRTALEGSPRARLGREELWGAFALAFPIRPQGPEERRWFRTALDRLAADGIIRLPGERGGGWDRSQIPPIPLIATLCREGPTRRDDGWRTFPWHPVLAWVADQRTLAPYQIEFLRRVHLGLREGHFQDLAPLKYRSLQLTGDEKRLQILAKTTLFGPGRLSFEILGCLPDWLPLAVERVGSGSTVLVLENAGPFDVTLGVFRGMTDPLVGLVAFGDGNRIERSLPRLLDFSPRITRIAYVGDLDRPGLRIARAAARLASLIGLPPVEPLPGVHRAMLEAAAALGAQSGWPVDPLEDLAGAESLHPADIDLVSWLPENVRDAVRGILAAGRRVPEEVLGPTEWRAVWRTNAQDGAASGND